MLKALAKQISFFLLNEVKILLKYSNKCSSIIMSLLHLMYVH